MNRKNFTLILVFSHQGRRKKNDESSWCFSFWGREDLIWRCRRHPEPSLFEGVAIS